MSRLRRRLRALLRGAELDRELEDEMRFHLELEAAELARTRGLSPEEAARQARVAFGGVARHGESHRDARGLRWLTDTWGDLRYAARALRRSPAYTLAAIAVLALGIGASVAAISAARTVLVAPLPYPASDRLVRVYQQNSPTNRWTLSVVDYRALEEQARTLAAVGAIRPARVGVSAGGEAERLAVTYATAGVFRALDVTVGAGRLLAPDDERAGAPRVALVRHEYAVRTFGGDAAAIGRSILVDGLPHTVVGVLAESVEPLAYLRAPVLPIFQPPTPTRRGPFGLHVVARLADGVTLDDARRDLAAISERIFPLWASGFQDREATLTPVPLRQAILGEAPRSLGILLGAVLLVLLIGVVNVAGLSLVRATARGREIALRSTLGAGRARLVRLLVTESVLLASLGAAVGLLVAVVALDALIAIAPQIPRLAQATVGVSGVAVALGTALVAAIIISASPVAMLLGGHRGALQGGTRSVGAGRGTHGVRSAFVVAQFALALPLLAAGALLLNSFVRLQAVDPGFDPERLVAITVPLPGARYADRATIEPFWQRALARVREMPGVTDAGLADAVPPNAPSINENNFDLIDKPVPPGGAQPTSPWPSVTPSYFSTLEIPLLEGRMFTPSDTGAEPVVLVSRAWATHYFPDGSAVGRRLISGGCTTCPPTTVIGVVGDVKYLGLGGTSDAVYDPLSQGWPPDLTLFVRTTVAPAELLPRIRAVLTSIEPALALDAAGPMSERVYASLAQPRHWAAMVGAFAAVAVLLAAVGVFGMLSYTVSARRREIGVRMALGARRRAVVAMVLRRGFAYALVGIAIGIAMSVVVTRWMSTALFEVEPGDPATLGVVSALLLLVALAACWLPARRAAAIDPVEALRAE